MVETGKTEQFLGIARCSRRDAEGLVIVSLRHLIRVRREIINAKLTCIMMTNAKQECLGDLAIMPYSLVITIAIPIAKHAEFAR